MKYDYFEPFEAPLLTQKDGVLFSSFYQDISFQKEALLESQHHYINATKIQELSKNQRHICVGELGFGTGLNFLLTLKAIENRSRLSYFAIEKHPISLEALKKALMPYREQLEPELSLLLEKYPKNIDQTGVIRLSFGKKGDLTLWVGDVSGLASVPFFQANAWYLDGFLPKNNPAMWDLNVLSKVRQRTAPDALLSTFNASSSLQKNLLQLGFEVFKKKGFGPKREHIVAKLPAKHTRAFLPPKTLNVVVLGAGLSGLCTSIALLKRGHKVSLYEKESQPFSKGSGNPYCSLYASPPLEATPRNSFYRDAYRFAVDFYQKFQAAKAMPWVNLHPFSAKQENKINDLMLQKRLGYSYVHWLDSKALKDTKGLIFESSYSIHMPSLCQELLLEAKALGLKLHLSSQISNISSEEHGVAFHVLSQRKSADALVYCGAASGLDLILELSPFLQKMKGQSLGFLRHPFLQETRLWMKRVEVSQLPTLEGGLWINSTYERKEDEALDFKNSELLWRLLCLDEKREIESMPHDVTGFCALRLMPKDALPWVGEHPTRRHIYLNTAHGARGISSIPWSSEGIADLMTQSIPAFSLPIQKAIAPKTRLKKRPI